MDQQRKTKQRILREYSEIQNNPVPGLTVGELNDSNMFEWTATIEGPEKTPYSGGLFKLKIILPENFPFKAPTINFETRVYHPNITNDDKGNMCLAVLRDGWKPNSKLLNILHVVQNVLAEPLIDDAIETSIAEQYKSNRTEFEKTAREYVSKYASKNPSKK